jgi:maltose O-acetyltransferase
MRTEKDKMLSGELYNPFDQELIEDRKHARILILQFNNSLYENERKSLLKLLIPSSGKNLDIQAPFFCDYGSNIHIGDGVFFNFNCIILDVMEVQIGSRSMFGPNVQIYTALHPMDFKERSAGLEYARKVKIGEDVWIGGSAVICPGVSVGNRTVIGAGSVVTRDIPDDAFAAGNPCRIIRYLN